MGRPRGERKFGRRIERNAVGLEHREWVRSSYPILRATGSQSFKQGSDRIRFFVLESLSSHTVEKGLEEAGLDAGRRVGADSELRDMRGGEGRALG